MDFGSGLWIKEALHSVPKESKPLACIDNEHAAQGLKKQMNISYIVYDVMANWILNGRSIPQGSCHRRFFEYDLWVPSQLCWIVSNPKH